MEQKESETAFTGQSQELSQVLQGVTVAPGTRNFLFIMVMWDRTCTDALDFLDKLHTHTQTYIYAHTHTQTLNLKKWEMH